MSLWGKSDNITSAGTVKINYTPDAATGEFTITGTSTKFGTVGAAKTGDVIRIGIRSEGTQVSAGTTFFGDAVITDITSDTSLTIGSTSGLSDGVPTTGVGTHFYVSELPSYTVEDHQWSNKHDTVATYKTVANSTNLGTAGVGYTNIAFKYKDVEPALAVGGAGKDSILIDGGNIEFASLGTATTKTHDLSPVGTSTVFVEKAQLPNISDNSAEVVVTVGGASGKHVIVSSGATFVAIGGTISAQVAKGDTVTFHSPHLVGLASTIPVALADGDALTIQRKSGGYDRIIYGVSVQDAQTYGESTGKYRTSGSGWVGVTTYIDCDNQLRVKSEILVAIGPNKDNGNTGITTGSYGIAYPTAQ